MVFDLIIPDAADSATKPEGISGRALPAKDEWV